MLRYSNFDIKILTSGEAEEERANCMIDNENENEEELLRRAIALSLEEN